jgi:FdhD protein
MADAFTTRGGVRIGRHHTTARADCVAVEEPLSIQLDCNPLAVTMRTPGHDEELGLGFLFAEGILTSMEQVGRVVVGGGEGGAAQLVNVVPSPGASLAAIEAASVRRGTLTTSACGVCGREQIGDLVARCRPLEAGPRVDGERLVAMAGGLEEAQGVFARTGGVHAAGVFGTDGALVVCREDVGRHNAVDKVVGALLRAGRVPATGAERERVAVLVVSGRASFEIVQKAVMARIPVVASVSAASSLAVDLARACNLTLVGFVRGGGAEVYAGLERVV